MKCTCKVAHQEDLICFHLLHIRPLLRILQMHIELVGLVFTAALLTSHLAVVQESMQAEGKLLASTPYGAKILEVLGSIYTLQADMVLGGNCQWFQELVQELPKNGPTADARSLVLCASLRKVVFCFFVLGRQLSEGSARYLNS